MASKEQPEPKSVFGGEWREADMKYARDLVRRGLLPQDRIYWRDPTCLGCGHRGWDHGLANLGVPNQHRWFKEEPTACEWKGCDCKNWRPDLYAKHPAEYVGQVRVTDTWIEVPLGRSWIAAYRIVNQGGRPVVGEIRIFPDEPERPGLGFWSGDLLGAIAKVPRGGITSRQVRSVRVRAYQRYMAGRVEHFRAQARDMAKHWGWGEEEPTKLAPPKSRRGRKGRADEFYARIAADYVQAIANDSKRPIQDIAARRKIPGGQVRDMIRQARQRGLLTKAEPGVLGGELTPVGAALVPKDRIKSAPPRGKTFRLHRDVKGENIPIGPGRAITPGEFKKRNPGAPRRAVEAYRRYYETTGKSFNETQRGVERFRAALNRG